MNLTLRKLRDLATNTSTLSSFQGSVHALEEAFSYETCFDAVSWRWLREGSDTLYFGGSTLKTLFGEHFVDVLSDRKLFNDSTVEYAPGVSSELRLEFQQYAVVGRRATPSGEQATCLILHAPGPLCLDGMERPADAQLSATALLRLRAGLMSRRQATLLANHLNRFRNNPRHREPLGWSVVRGPEPDADARAWADAVLGRRTLLRANVGANDSWGLGPSARERLSAYAVQVESSRAHQVFSYGPPQVFLPPRYELSAQYKGSLAGMPEGYEVSVTRGVPCEASAAVARLAQRAGLLSGAGQREEVLAEDLWGRVQDGVPGGDELVYMAPPADVYSRSLSRSEAIATMKALRRLGFRRVEARLVGADGCYIRFEGGRPHFAASEVTKAAEITVSIGDMPLPVRLLTCHSVGGSDFKGAC